MDLKQGIKQAALAAGADLFGVADIGRFEGVAPEHHPLSIKPETRSVIVLGKRIVRGALRGVEEGTHFQSYNLYGYNWLDQFLAIATFQTCAYLEDQRWEAVPLMNLPPQVPPMGIAVRPGQPEPNVTVDCDEAAVRGGLGEIGYCGMLLTPQFGHRQRVQAILTAAELEPDPILAEPICNQCMACVESCPFGAISKTATAERVICGKVMPVAAIDYSRCTHCQNGPRPNKYHKAAPPDRTAAICMRSCLDQLGREGRIEDVPQQPFRRREPWVLTPHILWGTYEGGDR
jgi:epoxyqueuosine reductase